MKKIILGLSGGVDSSVAAWLLLQEQYTVEALFMKNWEQDDTDTYCSAATDLNDAQAVADQLGIKLHVANFSKAYWDQVFAQFLDEYSRGRTPNPDILCNKEIKFKAFFDYALGLGADGIATGHYASLQDDHPYKALCKAKDRTKDQTYFLHAINPEVLSKTLFPLGAYLKTEVRAIAKQLNLPTSDKKDSTGICFIGERRFKTFLNEYLHNKPGKICASTGEVIGQHDGLMFYTIGQRQGLGIGGREGSTNNPWYVVDKEMKTNTLIVAQGSQHPMLYAQGLICGPIHWLMPSEDRLPLSCYAKIRYRQTEEPCLISPTQKSGHCVIFSSPQRAVTPGQYIVFYEKKRCLGGALIEAIIR